MLIVAVITVLAVRPVIVDYPFTNKFHNSGEQADWIYTSQFVH